MEGKKTILVTGANGQLGNEMQVIASAFAKYDFLFVTKEALAIDDIEAVKKYFAGRSIDYCVNCAAYTAVDKAESEPEKAMLINATAVGNLAKICKGNNTQFIHISTDYVFDGTATRPYLEDDPVSPVNLYGASKLKGELLAFENNPQSIIIRTSWVYSSFGNNFVKTMLRLMGDREGINVVSNQQGCPTYAADLASAIMHIIIRLQPTSKISNDPLQSSKIFNYSNKGNITWYEFALAIKELSHSKCIVNPIPAAQYPTPAKRPQYSVMDCTKIEQTFNPAIPEWKESLEKCLKILLGS
ncbi:MAG: dTDP-4-dehydrorhamnose reductase [Ferruginibacter sp.]|nr:dTDP-4-dehydrorhamnose reductase [Ferruginibacter sp.]